MKQTDNPRPIKVLLELLLLTVQTNYLKTNWKGLCVFTNCLEQDKLITLNEYYIIKAYLNANVPTHMWRYKWWRYKWRRFVVADNYWFNPKSIAPRVKYLKNRIKHESN